LKAFAQAKVPSATPAPTPTPLSSLVGNEDDDIAMAIALSMEESKSTASDVGKSDTAPDASSPNETVRPSTAQDAADLAEATVRIYHTFDTHQV
jgi:hypothetical protein